MALTFNGTTQYASRAGAALTATPITFACWFNAASTAGDRVMMSLGVNGGGTNLLFNIGQINGASAVRAIVINGASNGAATSTASSGTGSWHHAAGVFATTSSRAAYLDGTNKGTNATVVGNPTPDTTTVGAGAKSTGIGDFWNGSIAEAAIWNVALDDAEIASLAAGYCPLLIRPTSLVVYYPLMRGSVNLGGSSNTTADRWNSNKDLTEAATPTISDHPRTIYLDSRSER